MYEIVGGYVVVLVLVVEVWLVDGVVFVDWCG